MNVCCAPCCSCFFLHSFACLCSFMLSLDLLIQHMKLLCSILCLRMIFMSHRHLIAWVSKVSFIISGSAWACNFVPFLRCQQPSSCIRCIRYASVNCCSWCYSLWCFFLMSLSMNILMSSWIGKLIETWSTASPSVLWMVSSSLLSWKPLYPYCWAADEHLW